MDTLKNTQEGRIMDYTQNHPWFKIARHPKHRRLYQIKLNTSLLERFFASCAEIDIQRLSYVAFERYCLANEMVKLFGETFAETLRGILHDRNSGGFTVSVGSVTQEEDNFIKFSTAISHIIGNPLFDAMVGNYFAKFEVKHTDNSDTYLRSAYSDLKLHTDGAYEPEIVEWLLMMKLGEKYAEGGNTKLLHIDDWEDLKLFSENPIAFQKVKRQGAKSKNVEAPQYRPTFFRHNGSICICFAEQNIKPESINQALYFKNMSDSLESSPAKVSLHLPVGELVMVNNLFWLHGREPFVKNEKLNRVLLRQRGRFYESV